MPLRPQKRSLREKKSRTNIPPKWRSLSRSTRIQWVCGAEFVLIAVGSHFPLLQFLSELGLSATGNRGCYNGSWTGHGSVLTSRSPATGAAVATITQATLEDLESCMVAMETAKKTWFEMPAPARGEIVRQIGNAMRVKREALGALISLEMGKIASEVRPRISESSLLPPKHSSPPNWLGRR